MDEVSLRRVLDVDPDDSSDESWFNLVRCQDRTDYNETVKTKKEQKSIHGGWWTTVI